MSEKVKADKRIGKSYVVVSGGACIEYAGCVAYCIEVIKSKRHGVMLKLGTYLGDMWFNESELSEV